VTVHPIHTVGRFIDDRLQPTAGNANFYHSHTILMRLLALDIVEKYMSGFGEINTGIVFTTYIRHILL
jgi:hypothetical protein